MNENIDKITISVSNFPIASKYWQLSRINFFENHLEFFIINLAEITIFVHQIIDKPIRIMWRIFWGNFHNLRGVQKTCIGD